MKIILSQALVQTQDMFDLFAHEITYKLKWLAAEIELDATPNAKADRCQRRESR